MTDQFKRSSTYALYPELFDTSLKVAPESSYRAESGILQGLGGYDYPAYGSRYYMRSYGYNQGPYAYYDFAPVRVYGSYIQPFPRPYTYAYGEFPQPLVTEVDYHVPPTISPFSVGFQRTAWQNVPLENDPSENDPLENVSQPQPISPSVAPSVPVPPAALPLSLAPSPSTSSPSPSTAPGSWALFGLIGTAALALLVLFALIR